MDSIDIITTKLAKLAKLDKHQYLVQKSQEWLSARKNLIAASEAGYLLGIKSPSSIITYLKNKLNLASSNDNLCYHPAIKHGNIYEDITRIIYETRYGVQVREYGLITTSKTSILGASPDGIVYNTSTPEGMNRIGRLIEIKNPYNYDSSSNIKPEYMVQIYQQQYVLDLVECDFIKTNIIGSNVNEETAKQGFIPYTGIDEFLTDIPSSGSNISNARIPRDNHSSRGMEKGIIIHFNDPANGEILREIYPIDKTYEKNSILEWIKNTKDKIITTYNISTSKIAVEYWYVAEYFEKTIEYDPLIFESRYLPRLELIWKLVTRLRELQTKHSSEVILELVNTTLLNHCKNFKINNGINIYKLLDAEHHMKNIDHLEAALKLEPFSKIELNSKLITIKTKHTKVKSTKKESIEYDF
jgi:putative phage-type endonuclease